MGTLAENAENLCAREYNVRKSCEPIEKYYEIIRSNIIRMICVDMVSMTDLARHSKPLRHL